VEARFGPYGDSVNVDVVRCTISPNIPKAQTSFWMHPMVLVGDEAQLEARFGSFGDSAKLDVR
jgi:hypothetical protein